jgi:hypothetical protein
MRSDDLVPILAADTGPALSVVQGTVDSWDTTTGANDISLASGIYSNLKLLCTPASVAAGQQVLILKSPAGWFILGRIRQP